MTDTQIAKQFKIKVSSLKRIQKDLTFAKKEVGQEEERLQKLLAAPEPDDFRVRQQKQVILESKAMVPDAQNRLERAATDLEMFMSAETFGEDLQEQKAEAEALLIEVRA
ncbi:hypothetical protein DIPPA_23533 [Diplonema papillatum]|nr:hypothetical protein DIPPA_23533 [Diplonema papillatum]